jgi:hypothetical protein
LGLVDAAKSEQVKAVFSELNQGVEGVAKGIKSMTDLSALVTSKIEGLQHHPVEQGPGGAPSDRSTS